MRIRTNALIGNTRLRNLLIVGGASLDGIDNAHVAGGTLASVESYSGERIFRGTFESPATRPDKEVLRHALQAVRTRQQVLISEQ
jgi:hypothetical protein